MKIKQSQRTLNNENTLKRGGTKKVVDESVVETWHQQPTLKTHALDRSYKTITSVSPLKHRVEFDMDVSPTRGVDTLKSPNRSLSRGRSAQKLATANQQYMNFEEYGVVST